MNKKQVAITGLLLLLMASLFVFQGLTKGEVSDTKLVDNNIGELKEYSIKNSKLKFELPNSWIISEGDSNAYVLYQGTFKDSEKGINGSIQLIYSDKDLNELAERDNANATIPTLVNNSDKVKTDLGEGQKYNITTRVNKGTSYINMNYYIRVDDEKIVKVCFNTKESEYKESNVSIYDTIVSTIQEKDK